MRNTTATVPELYPFSELVGFNATTEEPDSNLEHIPEEETRKPKPENPDLSNSSNIPSLPFTHFSEKETSPPPLPAPAPTVHMPSGLLGNPSEFRSTDNSETHLALNSARITTDNQKMLLTLNEISDGAKPWKQNKVIALNANPALWHDWKGINTTFYSNWEKNGH